MSPALSALHDQLVMVKVRLYDSYYKYKLLYISTKNNLKNEKKTHQRLWVCLKGDGENMRKELEVNKGRADQMNHEHKIRLRTFQEEIERVKLEISQKEESLRS